MNAKPLTVSQVSEYIKALLDGDEVLSQLTVCGEISNFKLHSSGHMYFTLKDEGAVISAVMFKGDASRLRFTPDSGMRVIVSGRISLFPKSGQYQVYVSAMQPDGVGALYLAYEQLRDRLHKEGLFNKSHKQPLPRFPGKIALVTSPTGAAVRDMLRILKSRFPMTEVLVCPVKVQGDGAASDIAAMIGYVNRHALADLIITGRGGGSLEDLWAFNEEVVARAIYASGIPVISAVGHEPDITIADYVADLRAATPSNAAELAVPDWRELYQRFRDISSTLYHFEIKKISELQARLKGISGKKILSSPFEYYSERRMALVFLEQALQHSAASIIKDDRHRLARSAATLDAISPLKVLSRGYALTADAEGNVIKSVKKLKPEDKISVRLSDGSACCTVDSLIRGKE